ncbi:MAG: DUF4124 domain-containing protein [Proteobacteria bacterium]|nr:DUF4124 domain-containing protein [Pseudomonadota bacterium]
MILTTLKQIKPSYLYLTYLLIFSPANSFAQSIYSWTDAQGKVHYSTSSEDKNLKPKDLPIIQKENLDAKIKNLKKNTTPTCETHSGVDCSQGADTDGSVICLDGYRDINMAFSSHCNEAKIQTSYYVNIDSEKEVSLKHDKKIKGKLLKQNVKSLQVSIRNLSGVKVNKIELEFILNRKYPVFASGPSSIEPYGAADFIYNLSEFERPLNNEEIEHSDFKVYCSNCGTILSTERNE